MYNALAFRLKLSSTALING